MSTPGTRSSAATAPAVGITAAMSTLGGAVVWFSTSDIGFALTAAVTGFVISLAIFPVVAATGPRS